MLAHCLAYESVSGPKVRFTPATLEVCHSV